MNTDYATKSDVAEVKAEVAEVKAEVAEVKAEVAEVKAEVAHLGVEMLERLEQVETRLLTEFHKYARATESRMHVYEVQSASVAERLAAIETRVRELESKL
jgi:uncharacterized protein involved in exopolysaccharide biosynthesis